MINAVHVVYHAEDAARVRAFLADVLGLRSVESGTAEEPWPIFALPPAELGVHPGGANRHELYLLCDDIGATVDQLRTRGVQFRGGIEDQGWGLLATILVPGGGELGLYEPRHASPLDV